MEGLERERKEEKVRQSSRNQSPAPKTCCGGGLKGKKSKSSEVLQAELTYINLTENNVYYAANHNQGVEHIPGIPKISLSEVERVVGRVKCDISTRTRRLYSHTEI